MCGIVGYVGSRKAAPILLDGLRRLEYRGYDSAGMAVCGPAGLQVYKTPGRLSVLAELTADGAALTGTVGVGHTRWATHGEPNQVNAHPQTSGDGRFAVVHNGIIENFARLKAQLIQQGYTFRSETDTEVVAQLLSFYYDRCGDVFEAVNSMLSAVEGAYALGIVCADTPDRVIAARKDAPLLLGCGQGENFLASDVTALLPYTTSAADPWKSPTTTSTGTWPRRKRAAIPTLCSRRSTSSPTRCAGPSPAASATAACCSAT